MKSIRSRLLHELLSAISNDIPQATHTISSVGLRANINVPDLAAVHFYAELVGALKNPEENDECISKLAHELRALEMRWIRSTLDTDASTKLFILVSELIKSSQIAEPA